MNSNNSSEHQSVMMPEIISGLKIKASGTYIDATFGRGGHTRAILARLNSTGRVLVIDQDPLAIEAALQLQRMDTRVMVCHGSFAKIADFCQQQGIIGQVNGILFDLGVCSTQLDCANRGFSFLRDGPLDMRMDPGSGVSAATWLNTANEQNIALVLKTYGEEKFARRIARAIVHKRKVTKITNTVQLANIIAKAMPVIEQHKHPATRSFQAIRIYINNELAVLQQALACLTPLLAAHGRLVVLSFHSLEDRIVKQFIANKAKGDNFPIKLPIVHNELKPILRKIGKALKPSNDEILNNIRARSAILRIAEKYD